MDRDELIEELRKAAPAGRLSCEQAHALAAKLGVPLTDIGTLCNELKIKITACQLGCF